MTFILPSDSGERKKWPVGTFLRGYFPDAICYLAHLSWVANQQHNPGEPMHWARHKSTDQEDTMMRHFMEGDTLDDDGMLHAAKVAWRALAHLQLELERLDNEKEKQVESGAGTVPTDERVCHESREVHSVWTCDCKQCGDACKQSLQFERGRIGFPPGFRSR